MNELFSFGVWVRQRRKALDLTQEALATQIGCAAATVRRIEADARRPSRQLAARLADALSLAPEQREPFVQAARAQLPVDQLAAPTHNLRALALPTYSRHANLPAQLTPLIGRPQELEQVAGLLRRADVRLVVLLGPGGIGKTRLAIEAATIAADLFRDGVVFVPLAAVNDANLILSSVADALKLYPHHDNEAGAQVQRYLQGRELLLVLDNVEQFVAGATVIADLASSAPGIKILMTSRVRLNLHAEWIVDVEGLPYPHDETRESLEDFAATGLFLQRARRAQSHFAVDEYNRTAIIRICTLLHGMPLGIELAAAWVRALTCQAILREIERGLHVLATTQQAVPERHRSVYATFEHSWRLLAAREQQAFSALTVFRGGFQRDAALAITDCSAEQLARLADHSLLHVTAEGRFDMHELMRQFVIDTLQARAVGHPIHVEQHAARQPTQRHCQYYLELLADQEAALRGDAPQNAVALLQPEIDNMRQAWQSAIERDAWQLLWRCLPAWARLYRLRGYYHEAQVLLEQALERLPALAGVALERDRARFKGQLLVCLAETLIMRASYRDARRRAEAATALATSADDPGLQGRALATLGTIHHLNREFDHALAQHQRAYTLLQQHGDARWTAQILLQIAKTHEYTHHWDQALAMQHEALAMFQTLRDQRGIATSWGAMGAVHYGAGNLDEALACQRKALDIVGVLDARAEIANYTAELGKTYWRLKKNEEALRYMLQAIALAEELELEHHGSEYHRIAGRLCLRMGQMQAAHTHMDTALQLAIRSGIPAQHVAALEGINALHKHEGNYRAALHNAEQALHLAREIGEKRLIALGHGRLGELHALLEQRGEAGRELEQAVRELRALGVSPNAPALPYYLLLLADVLLHQGNLAAAEARCDEAQRIVAAHAATLFEGKALAVQSAMIRARCRYAQGRHDEAVRALTSLITTTDDRDQHALLCYTLWQLTDDKLYASQALDAYQQLQSPAAPFSYQQRIAMLRRAGFDG